VETVAFYSYKGGVGRSVLLANAATYLATLGNGVVALDLDLEAPGLHYKLGAYQGLRGVVKYLVAAAQWPGVPPPLDAYTVSVPVPAERGWLRLMPAGPAPHQMYWATLKEMGEWLRLDDPGGQGLMVLLDLQARIADELIPEYLLIDTRAGVTELGALATTVLADTVVCVFAGSQESLDGTLTVAQAIKMAARLKDQKPIRLVPVLLGAGKPPEDQLFTNGIKRLLELGEGRPSENGRQTALFTLPYNETLGASDRVIGVQREYLELFQRLFPSSE
jgi:cellulose biosynthesis protein BcsQ